MFATKHQASPACAVVVKWPEEKKDELPGSRRRSTCIKLPLQHSSTDFVWLTSSVFFSFIWHAPVHSISLSMHSFCVPCHVRPAQKGFIPIDRIDHSTKAQLLFSWTTCILSIWLPAKHNTTHTLKTQPLPPPHHHTTRGPCNLSCFASWFILQEWTSCLLIRLRVRFYFLIGYVNVVCTHPQ